MIRIFIVSCFLLCTSIILAQSEEQKAMAKLSFMIGDWKGSGSGLPKTNNMPYDVLTKVRYDLDGSLLVLKHRSTRKAVPVLSLHTLIYYNKKDQHYYYNAYRETGSRPFKCSIENQQLHCEINGNYRLTFQRTSDGAFNEFGERLVNGKWVKNFEDLLFPTSEITF